MASTRRTTSVLPVASVFKAVDLFCGLGGWTDGLLAEEYDVVGYDIERHQYGEDRYPAELILQDVCTLHGSQFQDVDLITASPPCQKYSYMAMPFSRGRAQAAAIRADESGAALAALNELFNVCFRIQREASEAAGRHIPMVVENVRGARPWVGPAVAHYGSFYLWGDVPLPLPDGAKSKLARKYHGDWFSDPASPSRQGGQIKQRWFNDGPRNSDSLASSSSNSLTRKAASAALAKIPLELARHVARAHRPW